jgi:hypothetical protein
VVQDDTDFVGGRNIDPDLQLAFLACGAAALSTARFYFPGIQHGGWVVLLELDTNPSNLSPELAGLLLVLLEGAKVLFRQRARRRLSTDPARELFSLGAGRRCGQKSR